MKKRKNIMLLIGIVCVFAVVVLQVVKSIVHYFSLLDKANFQAFTARVISPIVILFLLLIIPVILLVRNLKNKTGKRLPVISIIINGTTLLWVLFLSVTPAVPQYLIYNKLGLIDTYFTLIGQFLESGGLLLVIGYISLMIGSFLSLSKRKKQNIIETPL